MHEIDYKIFGDDMQFVEVELDPNEATVAEAGGMMYMDDGIEMETIFGDGSQQQSGVLGALMGAGKRLLTGESLFMTVFHEQERPEKEGRVRRAVSRKDRRHPSRRARRRADRAEGLVSRRGQRASASASRFSESSASACSAAKGSSCSACRATAWAFVHAGGTLHERTLGPGELIRVDTGCIVALPAHGDLRHRVRRQDQVGAVRRRRVVLRHAARAREKSGCNRCRSAVWRTESWRRCRVRPKAAAKKDRCSDDWEDC